MQEEECLKRNLLPRLSHQKGGPTQTRIKITWQLSVSLRFIRVKRSDMTLQRVEMKIIVSSVKCKAIIADKAPITARVATEVICLKVGSPWIQATSLLILASTTVFQPNSESPSAS